MDPRLLQLADSAFPTGAFAHSLGLEAMWQLGQLRGAEGLALRLRELVRHTSKASLPFLNDAHQRDAMAADRALEAFLTGHVANRASRAQGQAFLLAADATFGTAGLRERLPFAHAAVACGAALAGAGFALDDARRLFLFGAVRSASSAAVRLGVVGPLAAQRLLFGLHAQMDDALEATRELSADDAHATAPLLDILQTAQDRLYSRLFQS